MKKLLLVVGLLASVTLTNAQSNTKGTIQLGLGWAGVFGGATIESKYAGVTSSDKGLGARSNTGVRGQYGLSENFSAGIYLRTEHAAYVTTSTSTFGTSSDFTTTNSGIGVGLEAKYYFVNKDKFAFYGAPSIGFCSTKDTYTGGGTSGKSSGLEYGLNAGINWWFANFIGMSADLGYQGIGLKGKVTGVDYKIKGGGLLWGIGLVVKFGGDK